MRITEARSAPFVTTVCFSTDMSTMSMPGTSESAFLTLFAHPPQCISTKNSDFTAPAASDVDSGVVRLLEGVASGRPRAGSALIVSRSFAKTSAAAVTAAADSATRVIWVSMNQ